jgi:hypothetical protein
MPRQLPHQVQGLLLFAVVLVGLAIALTAVIPVLNAPGEHTLPPCPASHCSAVGTVPAGPRPCVLFDERTSHQPPSAVVESDNQGLGTCTNARSANSSISVWSRCPTDTQTVRRPHRQSQPAP